MIESSVGRMQSAVDIFEAALTAEAPIKKLLLMASNAIQTGDFESLGDIDVMLSDRFVVHLRRGAHEDLLSFQDAILSFIDGNVGDLLKNSIEGNAFYHRWNHFHDLCRIAVENYDSTATRQFVESRKYGRELLGLLYRRAEGIRHNQLAGELGISPQYLSKLLREFAERDLITRARNNRFSLIRLGAFGRTYVKEYPVFDEKIKESKGEERDRSENPQDPATFARAKRAKRERKRQVEKVPAQPVPDI